ncbi:ABC-F family ATP-binding cassette domain-containing protein [Thermospira aquatica]|uniref:ABC-F family ATP-binding cassette domain-containing protein n=1 Tax=Thermospira aquatica TaxID=2828656 RepID=A0AAX3BGD8_9SPIR|nr:ABC-F family ATP-binding cassette domain-containing protein [Thermospira aquatica]URA11223.1 ABC-F family ATP-binding cassette domain-containing protein [Thermospira aquatica]
MIAIENVSKSYGGQKLFTGVSFTIHPRERIGLCGRNGSGKTTLLRILAGEEEPDTGRVVFPREYRVGYLKQHHTWHFSTVVEELCHHIPGEEKPRYQAEKLLHGLGFSQEMITLSPDQLSGGYQMRLALACVLIAEPNLLLLDEPTNYLDIVSIRFLKNLLRGWKGELVVISHDRDFLDDIITHTLYIHRQRARKMEGETEKMYQQIALEEEVYEKTRIHEEKKRQQIELFISRFRAKARLASQAKSRARMLAKMEKKEKLEKLPELDFHFSYATTTAKILLEVENLSFGYDRPLFQKLSFRVEKGECVAVVGRNGQGKTTLLEVLRGNKKPWTGTISYHPQAVTHFFGQSEVDKLHPDHTIEEEILTAMENRDRTQARTIAGLMLFEGELAEKTLKVLSGGERHRVLLGKLLARPANLLLLDEPTNHLDMDATDALLAALDQFPGGIVLVTHNESFLRVLATKFIIFDEGKVRIFEGTYDDFLEKIGWAWETEDKKTPPQEVKKNTRQKRAEIVQEKSRLLRPLQKQLETLEQYIISLEEKKNHFHTLLLEASATSHAENLRIYGKSLKEIDEELQKAYEDYYNLATEVEEKQKWYEQKLEEIDSL